MLSAEWHHLSKDISLHFCFIETNSLNMATERILRLSNGKVLGDSSPVYIIAELGQNHQGDIAVAEQMARAAAAAGADCIKLQRSSLSDKFTVAALDRPYASQHSFGATYGEHKEHLQLDDKDWLALEKSLRRSVECGVFCVSHGLTVSRMADQLGRPFC
jgi:sialic acid synthase